MLFKKHHKQSTNDPFAQFAIKLREYDTFLSEAKGKLKFSDPKKFWYPYKTLVSMLTSVFRFEKILVSLQNTCQHA